MDRREFLSSAATLLVLPLGTFLVHCGSNDNGTTVSSNPNNPATDTTPPDAPPQLAGSNVVYTTSKVNLHSHSFTVPDVQFTVPTGLTGNTTAAQAHTHTITITSDDLTRAENGETVKIPTSTEVGHNHVLTLVKV